MNTPALWIFIPFLVGMILFFLRRWYRLTALIGTLTVFALALSALLLPVDELIRLGPWVFKIRESIDILGRSLLLSDQDRPLLVLIYILAAFWFSAAFQARAGRTFIPIGLILIAVWIAALAVEPFLYSALLLELAVLLSVPLLAPPGAAIGRGIIRYLIFQTFGMPFILLTGWLLAGVESSPGNLDLVVQATTLLGFGFLFLLAIFPFHSWLPMIAEEVHPYAASFIFFFLPLMVSLFGLKFLDQYAWLRQSAGLYEALRLGGAMMVLIGGVWAAFQQHLGRIMGFATLMGTGIILLSIGVEHSLELFFAMQIPRSLALAVWGLSLSIFQRRAMSLPPTTNDNRSSDQTPSPVLSRIESLSFHNMQGFGRTMPLAAAATALATLSLAGYPLLSGFPVFQTTWRDLAVQVPYLAILGSIGSLGLGIASLRSLAILVMGKVEVTWQMSEERLTAAFLGFGILFILLLGLFPQWILPYVANISQVFPQITSSSLVP